MSDGFTVEYDHLTVNPATKEQVTTHHVLTIGGKQYAENAASNLKANRYVSNVVVRENVEGVLGI